MNLKDILLNRVKQTPDALALHDNDGYITYAALESLIRCFSHEFNKIGVQPDARIAIWLEKSAYAVAAMQGTLRLASAYVPLDPLSPVMRVCAILQDCEVRVLVTTYKRADMLRNPMYNLPHLTFLCVDDINPQVEPQTSIADRSVTDPESVTPDDKLAYILYTSGSTGKAKGVCISNRNALAFIEWASEIVQATSSDRFANHAPFHFDLSVFDLYVAFTIGAIVYLIPDGTAFLPIYLVELLMLEAFTIWYSVPSVLILMMEQGGFLDREYMPLRVLLYAGEPFPVKYVRTLAERWLILRILNLYGPTETNVCTFHEIQRPLSEGMRHIPIGKACSGNRVWAQKEDGTLACAGEEGELMVEGPGVMLGYWGQPAQRNKPYATGDIVRVQKDGNYVCVGRRDHMVKVRGYRIELGEIEAVLLEHPAINKAVVQASGTGMETRLVAWIVLARTDKIPTLLEMKRYCAAHLPRYMIIDAIRIVESLPHTRNGKIDRQALFVNAQ